MTGEITLRGKVLPSGGVKEKVLAAQRVGIKTVILPRLNERDLDDVPAELRSQLQVVLVDTAEDVLAAALEEGPETRPSRNGRTVAPASSARGTGVAAEASPAAGRSTARRAAPPRRQDAPLSPE